MLKERTQHVTQRRRTLRVTSTSSSKECDKYCEEQSEVSHPQFEDRREYRSPDPMTGEARHTEHHHLERFLGAPKE